MCAKCRDSRGAIGGFDLPTEVQWEIAARAGSAAPFGSYLKDGETVVGSAETSDEFAVLGETSAQGVGSKLPNAWGLFDTAGNVWEWCRDDYTAAGAWTSAETPKVNDDGLGKVIRGGCYDSAAADARLTNRNNHSPSAFNSDSKTGFRLSMTCN
jgi:formylglycine-generating enzyme required for sulfatase activity